MRKKYLLKGLFFRPVLGKKLSDGLLEGLDTFKSETRLEVPRCLIQMTKNEVFVPVTNLSDSYIGK